jgi:hypothetical protein
MRMWNRLCGGRRRQFEAYLKDEIAFHREMERAFRADGGEGRFFGSTALALELSRDAWGFAWLDSPAQDLRYIPDIQLKTGSDLRSASRAALGRPSGCAL